ncbi:MAG: long-chain fatty acid--CoA ligase [Magnetococcales bacterium]|nr:long-chain fatty acid--CoA ligase [Magnetococcales bacterium]
MNKNIINEQLTISPRSAKTLSGLFQERVNRSRSQTAYIQFDPVTHSWQHTTWGEMETLANRWRAAMVRDGLYMGNRVAVMLANSREWVLFDQAALGLGVIVVPLFVNDRPESVVHILKDSGAKLLLVADQSAWMPIIPYLDQLPELQRVVCLEEVQNEADLMLTPLSAWLPDEEASPVLGDASNLAATLIYTSGTTGAPKGVVLTHKNLLYNAWEGLQAIPIEEKDLFLSFLPLSHALERTAGYYLPMMAGSSVAFARSIALLAEDFLAIRPTVILAVPRIFERIRVAIHERLEQAPRWRHHLFADTLAVGWKRFLYEQGREQWSGSLWFWPVLKRIVAKQVLDRFGGRLRLAVCGGARLDLETSRFFLSLGLPLVQGYGLTEAGPVVSVNTPNNNTPENVGAVLPGTEVTIGANDELLVRGPGVMAGYWNNPDATHKVIDGAGWLHTGDQARLEGGRIRIKGRIKEIIVMANGLKVSPGDVEAAIAADPIFSQVLVVGEARPFLTVLAVMDCQKCRAFLKKLGLDPNSPDSLNHTRFREFLLARMQELTRRFPNFAMVREVTPLSEPWTVENGLITPTLKPRRNQILEAFANRVEGMYQGHAA